MDAPDPARDRSQRILLGAIVVGVLAVIASAVMGIAMWLDRSGDKSAVATPGSFASPGPQAAGTAPGVALSPGESVVDPADATRKAAATPAPASPAAAAPPASPGPSRPDFTPYSPPPPSAIPAPAPPGVDTPAPPPRAVVPLPQATTRIPPPAPSARSALPPPDREYSPPPPPSFRDPQPAPAARSPGPTRPRYAEPRDRDEEYCVNCGTVAAISNLGDGSWEARVRFEDGAYSVFRFPTRPAFRLGDRVRLEDGRLNRD